MGSGGEKVEQTPECFGRHGDGGYGVKLEVWLRRTAKQNGPLIVHRSSERAVQCFWCVEEWKSVRN